MKYLKNLISGFIRIQLLKKKVVVLSFFGPLRKESTELVDKIKKRSNFLLNYLEAYNLYATIRAVKKVSGDIAEVGVYEGGSAMFMAEIKGEKALYLFDTFEGLPYNDAKKDAPGFTIGLYTASFEKVKNLLSNYKQVFIYKGIFPASAKQIEEKKFSFVHLDVDVYQSTLDSLNYFYSRLNRGGVCYFP